MKKIIFKNLKLSNFLSVGEEPVCVNFEKGLSLITGRNIDKPERRNAIGKSTIADAFYFCIFGETLRELKKDLIGNNITNGKTSVQLTFDIATTQSTDSYCLTRTLSPSKVFLSKNGEDITRDSISNTTKLVCDLLSASPAAFQNCIIMTINNAVPFMAKSKVEKRKFIEDIFGLEVFSKMLSQARADYNETKKQLDINNVKADEISNTLTSYQKQQETANNQKDITLAKLTARYNDTKQIIADCQTELQKISIQDVAALTGKEQALNTKLTNSKQQAKSLLATCVEKQLAIKSIVDRLNKVNTGADTCPTCLRVVDQCDREHIEKAKQALLDEKVQIEESLALSKQEEKNIEALIVKISDGLNKIQSLYRKNDEQLRQQKYLQDRIVEQTEWLQKIQKDIDQVDDNVVSFEIAINETRIKKQEIDSLTDSIKIKLNNYDILRFVVSEEGVKSFIVSKLLDLLNSRLQHYLLKLDSNTKCCFNEYFEEEILNEKGKVCSYFNFSGAERKAIDLACLFAFSDIRRMQGGVSYNLSIYDELFDSSFDEKGIELVTNILKDRVEEYQESSIVISHRKESLSAVTGEVIFLEKRNGITTRVDYSDF